MKTNKIFETPKRIFSVLALTAVCIYASGQTSSEPISSDNAGDIGNYAPQLGDIAPSGYLPVGESVDVGGNGPGDIVGAPQPSGWLPRPLPSDAVQVAPGDFANLLQAINNQTFESNQMPMVEAAGLCGWFSCSQCAALMNVFSFDDNRLKVVRYLAPHLIDPIRCQPIMDQLAFQSDRQTAWNIISAASL